MDPGTKQAIMIIFIQNKVVLRAKKKNTWARKSCLEIANGNDERTEDGKLRPSDNMTLASNVN